jgi:hypothetical protein
MPASVGCRAQADYPIGAMDEAKLREKLARIEALFAGATTEGERVAAAEARRRIQLRLQAVEQRDPPVEYRLTVADPWSGKILLALLRRYELKPYRYRNQRRTTIMVKAPASFINDTLWPEFQQISAALRTYVDQTTDRILADVFQDDGSDATEVAAIPQLPAAEIKTGQGE